MSTLCRAVYLRYKSINVSQEMQCNTILAPINPFDQLSLIHFILLKSISLTVQHDNHLTSPPSVSLRLTVFSSTLRVTRLDLTYLTTQQFYCSTPLYYNRFQTSSPRSIQRPFLSSSVSPHLIELYVLFCHLATLSVTVLHYFALHYQCSTFTIYT